MTTPDPIPRSVRWLRKQMHETKGKGERASRKMLDGFLRRVASEGGRCVGDKPLALEWPNGMRFEIESPDGRHVRTRMYGGSTAEPLARFPDGTEVPPAFVAGERCKCRSCGREFEQGVADSRTHVVYFEATAGGRVPLAAHQCAECAYGEGETESEHGARAYLDAKVERVLAQYASAVRH